MAKLICVESKKTNTVWLNPDQIVYVKVNFNGGKLDTLRMKVMGESPCELYWQGEEALAVDLALDAAGVYNK